jgi:hypothetical protein
MLKTLFVTLDAHPALYWTIGVIVTAAFAAWLVAEHRRERRGESGRFTLWAFAGLSLALLFAWRWPVLFQAPPFNPDEAQLVAAALTYAHDPVPFRSVDLTTSGPLNGLVLLPTHWLGVPQDYFNARLVAVLLEWGMLVALFAALRVRGSVGNAALALLPSIAFFTAAADIDLIHYTSEHLAAFLLALALWRLWRSAPVNAAATSPGAGWIAGGMLLGLLPWAKLQSVPVGAAIALWAAGLVWSDRRRPATERLRWIGTLVGGLVAPSAVLFVVIVATGQFEHFRVSYLAANIGYIGRGEAWSAVVHELSRVARYTWQVPALFGAAALLFVVHVGWMRARRQHPGPLYWSGLAATIAAFYAVLAPRHAFFHYLLLPAVPLTLWIATAALELLETAAAPRARQVFLGALIVFGVLPPFALRVRVGPPENYGRLAADWRQPYGDTARHIRKIARPGDRLAMWGWRPHLFVETGLPQGTREAHSEHQLRQTPLRDTFFRPNYLAEIRASRPMFFVDAVGPNSFAYDKREIDGHETFLALRDFIAAQYVLVKDFGCERLYMLREYAAARHEHLPLVVPLTLDGFTEKSAPGGVARLGDAPPPPPSERFYADQRIFGDLVPHPPLDIFAHAPSKLVHPLPPGTLRLRGAGAIRPAAFADPANGTDGATFAVHAVAADGSRLPLWKRTLAPGTVTADRMPAEFDLAVPADAVALEFTVDPGSNNSFDWTYWHDLRLDMRYCP